ncbi:nucleotidyltransferase domain-containing protein [Candidatus Peregrinibacteria bacterium]|nr:MAG: nucleotidyltransferase domain-containing protein [Candidatus Peregrinibacteria bacterium]
MNSKKNPPPGLTEKELNELKSCFEKHKDLDEVVLFGSRAMGNHKPGSDVDLLLRGVLEENTRFQVHDYLEEESLLPYFFDILTEKDLSNPALKKHIQEFGVVIYSR